MTTYIKYDNILPHNIIQQISSTRQARVSSIFGASYRMRTVQVTPLNMLQKLRAKQETTRDELNLSLSQHHIVPTLLCFL